MRVLMEQFGASIIYAIAGSGMILILMGVLTKVSV